MTRSEFKTVVEKSLEKQGCRKIKVSLSIAGLQGGVVFHNDNSLFKQEAHVWYREKDGKEYLKFEMENGMEWTDEL